MKTYTLISIPQQRPQKVALLRKGEDQGELADRNPRGPSTIGERVGLTEQPVQQDIRVVHEDTKLDGRIPWKDRSSK